MQNSPARLPDVGLGPRVGLPGRRQPAGYGTSWSVLVSSTSGRSGPSQPNLFHHFPSTNLFASIYGGFMAGGFMAQGGSMSL